MPVKALSKPILAIDFDDVLVSTLPDMITAYNVEFQAKLRLEDRYLADEVGNKSYGWKHNPTIAWQWIREYLARPETLDHGPIDGAAESILRLARRYEVVILTSRQPEIEHLIPGWLSRHMPGLAANVRHSGSTPKSEVCREVGAKIIIDDSPVFIHDCHAAGIEVIVFGDYPWNQADRLPEKAPRAKTWSEVEGILL